MTIRALIRREAYVAVHAQTVRFRIIKYLILVPLGVSIVLWKGWMAFVWTFLVLLVLSLTMHFIFRWKTKGWRQSWGLYKKVEIPEASKLKNNKLLL